MKERLTSLVATYKDMLRKEKSPRGKYILQNVIEDIENLIADL